MVYHIPRTGNRTAINVVLTGALIRWVFYALICYVITSVPSTAFLEPYRLWFMLGMGLPVALVASLQYRRIRRIMASYDGVFYTLTEGGVMIESDGGQSAGFFSWAEVTEARRVLNHTVYLKHRSGKVINCLLEGLPEARMEEFAEFAAKHAGTTPPPAALIRPPAELMSASPLCYSATEEQRRELADTRALLHAPAWVWTWLRPIILLLFCMLFLYFAYEAAYISLIIVGLFIRHDAKKLLHPGGGNFNHEHSHPACCYVQGEQMLLTRADSDSWLLARGASSCSVYHMPHGICVQIADAVIMLDPDSPLPPHLKDSVRPVPKLLPRPLIRMLLGLLLLCGMYSFSQSNTWQLHCLLRQDTPDIPTMLRLAQLPPSTQVTYAVGYMHDESANILTHSASGDDGYVAVVCMELSDGDSITAFFNEYAELVDRRREEATPTDAAAESADTESEP